MSTHYFPPLNVTLTVAEFSDLSNKVIDKSENIRKQKILDEAEAYCDNCNRWSWLHRTPMTVREVYNLIKEDHPMYATPLEIEQQAEIALFYIRDKHDTDSIDVSFDIYLAFKQFIGEGIPSAELD